MNDSSTNSKEQLQKKILNFALKLPAGQINERTPVKMITEALLKKSMEKTSSLDFSNPALSPILINNALNAIHEDWHTWLPETVYHALGTITNTGPASINLDKVRVIQILRDPSVCGNIGWDCDIFEKICLVLNNTPPEFSVFELPSLKVIKYGYLMMKSINPDIQIWDDVYHYIQALMNEEGLLFFPMIDLDIKIENELTEKIEEAWNSVSGLPIDGLMALEVGESALSIQIHRLIDIDAYTMAMME